MPKFIPARFSGPFSPIVRSFSALTVLMALLIFSAVAAWGGTVNTPDRAGLNYGFTNAPLATVTLGPSITNVTFSNNTNTTSGSSVSVSQNNQTFQGYYAHSSFASDLTNAIAPLQLDKNNPIYTTLQTALNNAVNTFFNTNVNSVTNWSYITGNNSTRTINGALASGYTDRNLNNGKWLSLSNNVTNFSINDVSFREVKLDYTYSENPLNGGGVVNGLIGNLNANAGNESFGAIQGNEFKTIEVTVRNNAPNDKIYLAGGGIIGLRSTAGSVDINSLTANIFRDLKVNTDTCNNCSYQQRPYIEGGGIIGVDGVSSPAGVAGHATIGDLDNNFFSNIAVNSGDILIGGGVVGVNNNSQNTNTLNNASIDSVSNNIFGDGTIAGLSVKTGFSLRGGGIVGINALSNSYTTLNELKNNVFSGIDINVGTYMRGGGVVGLQANDVGKTSSEGGDVNNPCDTATCPNVGMALNTAQNNIFTNISVKTGGLVEDGTAKTVAGANYYGGTLFGGGIIGLRSNGGTAIIANVTGNAFRQIDIKTFSVEGYTGDNDRGDLQGGGIIGISSATSIALGYINYNYFDNIKVEVKNRILGGGIIGLDGADAILTAATAGAISNNSFIGDSNNSFRVTAQELTQGGGIIGARAEKGHAVGINVDYNTFDSVSFQSKALHGGGLIGFAAPNAQSGGNAHLSTVNYNSMLNNQVVISDQVLGGGFLGIYSQIGKGDIGLIQRNTIQGGSVSLSSSSSGYLLGGGIIGALGADGQISIDSFDSNTIQQTSVNVNSGIGTIGGGGVVGAYSQNGIGEIGSVTNSTFEANQITTIFLAGGGIIGAGGISNTPNGKGLISNVSANIFKDDVITVTGLGDPALGGGGVIGSFTRNGTAQITNVISNQFIKEQLSVDSFYGGGLIGAYAANQGIATIEAVNSNTIGGTSGNGNTISIGTNIAGGGIVGSYSDSGAARIYNFNSNSQIANNTITAGVSIIGGGIVGTATAFGEGYIGTVESNSFNSQAVSAQLLTGGGLIGAVGSQNKATIASVSNNAFSNDTVTMASSYGAALLGGGIIGTMTMTGLAEIQNVTGNTFSSENIKSDLISGGGLVGAYADIQGASTISSAANNSFSGNNVTANSALSGGGLIGAYADNQGNATISSASNNSFNGDSITATLALSGSGAIGVFADQGAATISSATNNSFNSVNVYGNSVLNGGGLIGAYADNQGTATISSASNNSFSTNNITTTSALSGGGIVGAYSLSGNASINNFTSNQPIASNTVNAGVGIVGGGIVGAASGSGEGLIGTVDSNVFNSQNVSSAQFLTGGGIIGAVGTQNKGTITLVQNNAFSNDKVILSPSGSFLSGGGIIGAFTYTGLAEVKQVASNAFSNETIQADLISGGGIIGASSDHQGRATISSASNNSFSANSVTATSALSGGGIVGAYSLSGNANIDNFTSNQPIASNTVNAGVGIVGGGIVGAASGSGEGLIGTVESNVFNSQNVSSAQFLTGGGIIGAVATQNKATITTVQNNAFSNDQVTIGGSSGTFLSGGGIIGAFTSTGLAQVQQVASNTFSNEIIKSDLVNGGGLIGVYADNQGSATISSASNNSFSSNTVTATSALSGGGIVGAYSLSGNASIDNFTSNQPIASNTVNAGVGIVGGGIVGAASGSGEGLIGTVESNVFNSQNVSSAQFLTGGGIIGVVATQNKATITTVQNNAFSNDQVTIGGSSGTFLSGGGIIGAFTSTGLAQVQQVTSNAFSNEIIKSDLVNGGGLIGVYADNQGSATISSASNNSFSANSVTATSALSGGGIVGAYSLSGNASIDNFTSNQPITSNTVNAGVGIVGGGIVGAASGSGEGLIGTVDSNIFDSQNILSAQFLTGGGIIGAVGTQNKATITTVQNNSFSNDQVTLSSSGAFLSGGGIIGTFTSSGLAEVKQVASNSFSTETIQAELINGGGLIGASSDNHSTAIISLASNNAFNDNHVTATSDLSGGGIIGASSIGGNAIIDNVYGLKSYNNVISVAGTLRGGGILGVAAIEGGSAMINSVGADGQNLFPSDIVTASEIKGGGIIGAYADSNGAATLVSVVNNEFNSDSVTASSDSGLRGGGIIGTYSEGASSEILTISNNTFTSETVTSTKILKGGGIIGAYASNASASIDKVDGLNVSNIKVDVKDSGTDSSLQGGGIIGVAVSGSGEAKINSIGASSANSFTRDTVAAPQIKGGGLIGSFSENGDSKILSVLNNTFSSGTNVKATEGSIEGGGFIGAFGNSSASIGDLTGNSYYPSGSGDYTVSANGPISGGGIIGTYSSQNSTIDSIVDSDFIGLSVQSGTFIDGGLIGAVTKSTDAGATVGIKLIQNSQFGGNTIIAQNGPIKGGAVYVSGLGGNGSNGVLTISNSEFSSNYFYLDVTGQGYSSTPEAKVYGIVAVDSGKCNIASGSGCSTSESFNTLILEAEGKEADGTPKHTTFTDNNIIENGSHVRVVPSLYFGQVQSFVDDGNGTFDLPKPDVQSNAKLIVDAKSGAFVEILDPIYVDQLGDTFSGSFAMEVSGNGGEFDWGGDSLFKVGAYDASKHGEIKNQLDFLNGSKTTLLPGMTLEATEHNVHLFDTAYLFVSGWDNNKNETNKLTIKYADLNGEIHFELNGNDLKKSGPYAQGERSLLKVYSAFPDPDNPHVSVEGALITLGKFITPDLLAYVDQFYLIDAGEDSNNQRIPIKGKPRNDFAPSWRNYTTRYVFIIDYNDLNQGEGSSGREFLIARLQGIKPAPQMVIFTQAFAVGSAFIAQSSTWLPDHSYQQADLAIKGDDYWQIFAGVDIGKLSLDTMKEFDIVAGKYLAGIAKKFTGDYGKFLLGLYLEGGWADYDIGDSVLEVNGLTEIIQGEGSLRYIGPGLLARQTFDNNVRIEASFRGGSLRNSFRTTIPDSEGYYGSYKFKTPYLAAHLGLAYQHQINEVSSLDFVLRGYWSRLNGKAVAVHPSEDHILFSDMDSIRGRAGLRYTRLTRNDTYWYLGGYYDYEFDQKLKAETDDDRLRLDVPSLKGGTGVFEVGMISHPTDNKKFSLEFGFQGYVGKINGLSGGIRVGYEF